MRVNGTGAIWRVHHPTLRASGRLSVLSGRRGLTLVELLAAMLVLLVGVYAVAALFPKLSTFIAEEETRTSMSRAALQVAEAYRAGTYEAPDATAPNFANVDTVEPGSVPDDPDTNTSDPNSRDDFIEVFGEYVTVPQPAVAGGYACYVPKMGLVESVLAVRELRPLTEAYRDPGAGGSVGAGEYYLRSTGEFIYNSAGSNGAYINYDWYDSGVLKRAGTESVPGTGQIVQAVAGRGGSIVPGNARAYAVYNWNCTVGPPGAPPYSGNICWLDAQAGQSIFFPHYLAGKQIKIDYRLRREDPYAESALRRARIMFEDKRLPSTTPFKVGLNFDGLDDENPLITTSLTGTDIADIWVLMVDLVDGKTYVWDDAGDGSGDIADVDFLRGGITMNASTAAGTWRAEGRAGHPVRIYYRTIDEHCIQVQKAPTEFVEVASMAHASNSFLPDWQHRRYMVSYVTVGADTYAQLYGFPAYCEDQGVQVDYTVDVGGTNVRMNGEMHVISDLDNPALGCGFVLNQPNVTGILSVEGATMRVVGWWRSQNGRLTRYDVANMVFPGAGS